MKPSNVSTITHAIESYQVRPIGSKHEVESQGSERERENNEQEPVEQQATVKTTLKYFAAPTSA